MFILLYSSCVCVYLTVYGAFQQKGTIIKQIIQYMEISGLCSHIKIWSTKKALKLSGAVSQISLNFRFISIASFLCVKKK